MQDKLYWGNVKMTHYLARYCKENMGTYDIDKGMQRTNMLQERRYNNE